MKSVDNERAVSRATSLQQNVDGSLQACCPQNSVTIDYLLFCLQGYGAHIDHKNKVVSVPKGVFCRQTAHLSLKVRQYGWHTQIGFI